MQQPTTSSDAQGVLPFIMSLITQFITDVMKLPPEELKTVDTHRAAIMHKLNLSSPAALVRYAVRNKILSPKIHA
jgi:FixJ family two-component response regulator